VRLLPGNGKAGQRLTALAAHDHGAALGQFAATYSRSSPVPLYAAFVILLN
jgi:hypothetical protein